MKGWKIVSLAMTRVVSLSRNLSNVLNFNTLEFTQSLTEMKNNVPAE
jgi:hypothetical protein